MTRRGESVNLPAMPLKDPLLAQIATYGVSDESHAMSIALPDRHPKRTWSTEPRGRNTFVLVPAASFATPSAPPISIPVSYRKSG